MPINDGDLRAQLRRFAHELNRVADEYSAAEGHTIALQTESRLKRDWRRRTALIAAVGVVVSIGLAAIAFTPARSTRSSVGASVAEDVDGRTYSAFTAVGGQLFDWGGRPANGTAVATGGVYDVKGESWSSLPTAPIAPRSAATVVPMGSDVMVWGGSNTTDVFNDGAVYSSTTNSWTTLPPAPLIPRIGASAVWTGTEAIVFGGSNGLVLEDGAAYVAKTGTWRALPLAPLPFGDFDDAPAVWTGSSMVVVSSPQGAAPAAAAYDPTTNKWTRLADPPYMGVPYTAAAWADDHLYLFAFQARQAQSDSNAVLGVVLDDAGSWRSIATGSSGSLLPPSRLTALNLPGAIVLPAAGIVYQTGANTWQSLPDMPPPGAASVLVDGYKLVSVGGGTPVSTTSLDGFTTGPPATAAGIAALALAKGSPIPAEVQPVIGSTGGGYIDRSQPLADTSLGVQLWAVRDKDGALVGYFACRFYSVAQIEQQPAAPARDCGLPAPPDGADRPRFASPSSP